MVDINMDIFGLKINFNLGILEYKIMYWTKNVLIESNQGAFGKS